MQTIKNLASEYCQLGHPTALLQMIDNGINYVNNTANPYFLTDRELLLLYILPAFNLSKLSKSGRNSLLSRNRTLNILPEFDSALQKSPKFTGDKLFKFRNEISSSTFKIGNIIPVDWYCSATTNSNNTESFSVKFIITTLNSSKTKAREVYKAVDVNNTSSIYFERDTNFKVVDIVECKDFTEIHLEELP